MTDDRPLTDQQRAILDFCSTGNRYLSEFLLQGLIESFGDRQTVIRPLIIKGWIHAAYDGEAFVYCLTELGRAALRSEIQADQVEEPAKRPFWLSPRQGGQHA